MKKTFILFSLLIVNALIVMLVVNTAFAAESIKILSDNSWKSCDSLQAGWESSGFDDSGWRNAYAPYPYNTVHPPTHYIPDTNAVYMWDYPDYPPTVPNGWNGPDEAWFRKTFTVPCYPSNVVSASVVVGADDDFDFYVNGVLVHSDWDNTTSTAPFTIDIEPYLVKGENVFAMYAKDSVGGREWALVDATIQIFVTPEFLLTANTQHSIDVRLSNGDGTFTPPVSVGDDLGVNYGEFAIADFTGDGQLDFIASTNENPAMLYLFTRTGPTSFQQTFLGTLDTDPRAAYFLDPSAGNNPLHAPAYGLGLNAADLDNDGHMDFLDNIHHDFGENKYWIARGSAYLNDGSGNFTRMADAFDFISICTYWTLGISSNVVDVDGDGYPDMLASEQISGAAVSSKVYLLRGKGDGTFHLPVHIFTTDHHPATFMTLGDFNGDGKVDAIVGQDDDGDPGATFLFLGWGDGTFEQIGVEAFDTRPDIEAGFDQPGVGNFQAYDADHDGILDIISAAFDHSCQDTELLFFHGRGDGSFDDAQVIEPNILTNTAFVAPLTSPLNVKIRGDLDGDRDVDYDDYLIFRTAYDSCSGDDNFIPAADLDGDTCVTINDYRILRTLITP